MYRMLGRAAWAAAFRAAPARHAPMKLRRGRCPKSMMIGRAAIRKVRGQREYTPRTRGRATTVTMSPPASVSRNLLPLEWLEAHELQRLLQFHPGEQLEQELKL